MRERREGLQGQKAVEGTLVEPELKTSIIALGGYYHDLPHSPTAPPASGGVRRAYCKETSVLGSSPAVNTLGSFSSQGHNVIYSSTKWTETQVSTTPKYVPILTHTAPRDAWAVSPNSASKASTLQPSAL